MTYEIASAELEEKVCGVNGSNGSTSTEITPYHQRVSELEQSIQSTTSMLENKERITDEDLADLAFNVVDSSYEKMRNYFVEKMFEYGNTLKSNFDIAYESLGYEIQFSSPGRFRYDDDANEIIPMIELVHYVEIHKHGPVRIDTYPDVVSVEIKGEGNTIWRDKLVEDLPNFWNAYMLGYTKECIRRDFHREAFSAIEVHGLEDNQSLKQQIAGKISTSPKMAELFLHRYLIRQEEKNEN